MANKDDYLTDYRCFFENFAQTVEPKDQLPVRLASYKLVNVEVVGAIIDWTTQYLTQKKCPQSLVAPLIKIVIDETRKLCKKQPTDCGFNPSANAYEPLKLMQTVMAKTNEICLRYLDNSKLCSLPTPGPPYNATSVFALKNSRRCMEDRHVVIHDLNSLFIEQEASPSSYYAIFDGHAGHDAAAYSSAHLHQFLAESKDFISKPERALRDAFLKTDALFLDKCKVENLSSGTTAVCALHRHKEKTLYIAWVGDSQALLVSHGKLIQCVQPHKPSREDEKKRIEKAGGFCVLWGVWRVNGHLAVSRAIGDSGYKPYVTAVPDIVEIPLSGTEDFLILACDGLWDFISEHEAARCVYSIISTNPDDIDIVSQRLVKLAKEEGSSDNISVIVVFLRETSKVAAEARWATRNDFIMDTLDNANTTTNPFANSNSSPDILAQKEGFVLNLADGFKQNGTEKKSPTADFLGRPTNGKRSADEFDDDDDDLGPETDVDAVDDVLLSPATAKSAAEGAVNNNAPNVAFDPFCDNKEEKAKLETDSGLQKHQTGEFDPVKSPREETPTPPADSVHDTSGLVDNVAESGDDSEDEWNYYKGDQKENIPPSQTDLEVFELTRSNSNSDTMSQLNPNAAEFVPVSPKRNTTSPAYQALIDETVIAQSPRRATPNDIDINLPNPQEFEIEIKSRPSDVQQCANGSEDDDEDHKLTSQEIMENFLNGKSIDEIDFQPNSTPVKANKTEEFHFGPNATPFTTPMKPLDQSEALSTKAVFGDESTASYLEGKCFENSFVNNDVGESQTFPKEQDPMSMSFYQDKDDDTNPFDLNKVQVLPENIDDFLEKPCENNSFNETISDLPEHNPIEPIVQVIGNENHGRPSKLEFESDDALSSKSSVLGAQSPRSLPQSPLSQSPFPLPQSQSPLPQIQSPVPHGHSPTSHVESPLPLAESPLPHTESPLPQSKFPLPQTESHLPQAKSPIPQAQSPLMQSHSPFQQSQSPLPQDHLDIKPASPIPQTQSPLLQSESFFAQSHSPIPQSQSPFDVHSPVPPHPSQSPLSSQPVLSPSESPLPELRSPIPAARQSPAPLSPVIMQSHSPVPPQSPIPGIESPLEDITSSVKDSPVLASSPLETKDEEFNLNEDNFTHQSTVEAFSFMQEISGSKQETFVTETANKVEELIPDVCPISTPKSVASELVDTESVATADVNSFLERSLLPDMESPLSPTSIHSPQTAVEIADVEANKIDLINASNKAVDPSMCEYPINVAIDVKSEIIAPEYPVETIATPSEESKAEDLAQTVPQDGLEKIATVAGITAAAGTVAATAIAAATTQKKATPASIAKSKAATPAKKAAATKPATSPTKAPTPKSTPKTPTPRTTSTTLSATRLSQVKTSTLASSPKSTVAASAAAKTLTKPKTPTTTKSPEKKPLTNGDVKPSVASTLAAKRTPLSATTKSSTTKPVPNKASPTKPTADTKPTARPATAPPKTTTIRQTTTRPTTLVSKTASNATKSTTSSTVTTAKSTVKATSLLSPKTTTNLLSKPKPTTTTTMRSKPLASRPSPKAPDTEKQIKETTNKQITASRTLTATRTIGKTTGSTLTTTVRKTETKAPVTRTTLTKTTTTTVKTINDPKKPAELVRHPANKTKTTTTAIKKITKPQQNGIATEVNTITVTSSNIEPQLMKDVSPVIENVILDNSQIVENNVAD